jgi:multiple sugar transport system permease protein
LENFGQMFKGRGFFRKNEDYVVGYLFLIPDIIGLLLFWVAPMAYAIYLSFYKWNLLGPKVFVGLDNYNHLLTDALWWKSLGITAEFIITYVPSLIGLALFFAILLTQKIPFRNLIRTIYFVPYAMSLIVVGVIWSYIFEPKFGAVNFLLTSIGLPKGQWLTSPSTALFVITFVALWKYVGYYMVIFIAGLQEIPQDYYEAGKIDGANTWAAFRYITLPSLRPVFLFVLTICTISAFEMFDLVYIMTHGGPDRSTYITMMYIYEKAFKFFDFGYASSMSFILFLLIFVITMIQFRFFRRDED